MDSNMRPKHTSPRYALAYAGCTVRTNSRVNGNSPNCAQFHVLRRFRRDCAVNGEVMFYSDNTDYRAYIRMATRKTGE